MVSADRVREFIEFLRDMGVLMWYDEPELREITLYLTEPTLFDGLNYVSEAYFSEDIAMWRHGKPRMATPLWRR
jgi:hypothetical protein